MSDREIATYRCPQCRRQIRTLADEVGDHGCQCGWMSVDLAQLRTDIREYVKGGGWDAFSFALLASPRYDGVPGREIQRLIDEEKTKEADI
ncbi:hypothetical protein [Paenibacillus sp. YIM B09110]|uniref:hypothetical protein n=1 Tax=Paenibacillus sp. YIM B09110 TaxID=3126102 RepID=UPI00301D2BBB